jgi:hypothetical protein
MKVFAFLVATAFFLGGLLLFGVAFDLEAGWNAVAFAGGILGVVISLMIPFHLLERLD